MSLNPLGRPRIETIWKGQRFRAVGSRLYIRPPKETFHEFLISHLMFLLKKDWFNHQKRLPLNQRHQIMQWWYDYHAWKREKSTAENRADGGWAALPSGNVQSLLTLAHDVYQIAHCTTVPDELLSRLKRGHEFQGARYEIAVAAIFARIGCSIAFFPRQGPVRHAEFIAAQRDCGVEVEVEAKSRRRPGVLHEQGELDLELALRGDVEALFEDALHQASGENPFIVFIDLNALPTPDTPMEEKPWILRANRLLDKRCSPSPDSPDPFTALYLTNFAYHYSGSATAPAGELAWTMSPYPKRGLPASFLQLLADSVKNYGNIPEAPSRGYNAQLLSPPVSMF